MMPEPIFWRNCFPPNTMDYMVMGSTFSISNSFKF